MKTREFDPVRSAALRNALEALPDAPRPRPAERLRRPQVWITAVTAVVLVVATIGVLRITAPRVEPARHGLTSPLEQITDPSDTAGYVARQVRVLLDTHGTGAASPNIEVPEDVTQVRLYIVCTPDRPYTLSVSGGPGESSTCARDLGGSATGEIEPGTQTVSVLVPKGVRWAVTIIAAPDPTVSAGPVIDPLAAVRDLRTPDALLGDTRPILQMSGSRTSGGRTALVPAGVHRLRVYLVCVGSSASTRAIVDGRDVLGCMNSVAHWFDFSPSSDVVVAQVVSVVPRDWRLLVVPAPRGAKDSPANAPLPYPGTGGPVLAHAHGVGAQATGTYTRRTEGIDVAIDCRGTGWIEFESPDGGTTTRGTACGGDGVRTGFGGGDPEKDPKPQRWTVTPHGDISWSIAISASNG